MENIVYAKKTREEVESIILVSNNLNNINVHTSRISTMRKLRKLYGEPDNVSFVDGCIFDAEWNISLNDKDINKVFRASNYFLKK